MTLNTSERTRLAQDGGDPVRSAPFAPWPHYDEEQIAAVTEVLRSGKVNYWTGEDVSAFERAFAESLNLAHAVALANGTVALELALRGLGIGPGDDVVVTCRSFYASASCVVAVGARPVFADVDPVSQNVTAETIADVLTPETRAVIPVHLAGWPCEMDPILELARDRGLWVVEDCAQAHGAAYRDRPVGTFGHVSAWSFCQDKIITTGGEGGLVATDDPEVHRRIWQLKDHGKNPDKLAAPGGPGFKYVHDTIGTNARLTGPQAAIGRAQLERLPDWRARRAANAGELHDRLGAIAGVRLLTPPAHVTHAWYKYYCRLDLDRLTGDWTRDSVIAALCAEGVPAFSGACPEIYRERAFMDAGYGPAARFANARRLGEDTLMFPVHPTLSPADMDDIATAIEKVLTAAARP